MTTPIRTALVALAASAALVAAGCSSHTTAGTPAAAATTAAAVRPTPSPSPSPAGDPMTYDGAKAAVEAVSRAAAAHDGGTLWDLMASIGQAAMTRADYVSVVNGCPKIVTSTQVLSIAMNAAGTTATVTITAPPRQGGTYTFNMVYEAGRWRRQPSDGAMKWMGLGADKALAALRKAGEC